MTHRDIHGRPEVPQPLRILEIPMPFDNAHPVGSKISPEALMSDPVHMIAWLNTFAPNDVVCVGVGDADGCLGATFLRAQGFEGVRWFCHSGHVDGKTVSIEPLDRVARAISRLYIDDKYAPVTAGRALEALDA